MKKNPVSFALSLAFVFILFTNNFTRAQSPQGTSYQAIIRNGSGSLVSNRTVSLRFSIHDSVALGVVVYQEIQNPVTTAQGLVNINVGQGFAVVGSFSNINWGNKNKFLQVELDVNGGTTYTDMGTQQLMSVPYAYYANSANTAKSTTKADTSYYAANGMPSGTANGQMLYWNGNSWVSVNPGGYGQSMFFCDGIPTWGGCVPKVNTNNISPLYTTATSGGNVTADGGLSVSSRGVCWSTSINPTVGLSTKTSNGNGIGAFSSNITGLLPNTTYHLRAYATNSNGTAYGSDSTFSTLAFSMPVVNTVIGNVSYTNASSGGNVITDGGLAITAKGICWSTSANPTIALSTKTIDGSGSLSFTSNITGLANNTIYHVRAYATNSLGTAYGADSVFTTLAFVLPTITTTNIGYINLTNAVSGGSIFSDGGTTISARGICWSTNSNPTISLSSKTTDGNGIGNFSSFISRLSSNTTYYARAYATNSIGTSYGSQISFTTYNGSVAVLSSINIDTIVWSSKNLDVTTYRNGDSIPQVTNSVTWSNLTTGAWCWYNNDSATYAATYGRLYNWYAINDPRGLAPFGWHIPSNLEWDRMSKFVDATVDTTIIGSTGTTISSALKEVGTLHWLTNTGATNSTGFTALPGGYRATSGTFSNLNAHAQFWTASEYDSLNAWRRYISSNTFNRNYYFKTYGFSVRVIKD